jgi:methyl-accepting chemotaxis protein
LPSSTPADVTPRRFGLGRAWTNLRLAIKIPLLVVAAAIVSGLAGSLADYTWASRQLISAAEDKLLGLLQTRTVTVADYLASIQRDIRLQAGNPFVTDAFAALADGHAALGPAGDAALYRSYVTDNPQPEPWLSRFDGADDGSAYSVAHHRFHPHLRDFTERYGYRDFLLVDLHGKVVYSVKKHADFMAALSAGATGGLADAYRAATANLATGK